MTPTVAPETAPSRAGDTDDRCRCCGAADVVGFYSVASVPVNNSFLFDTAQAARAVATGDLDLGCCPTCGFIQNVAFDASLVDYAAGYEDTQAHSPRFVEFAEAVAGRLRDTYDLDHAEIVEIGSGKGDFLRILCDVTASSGVGYDPAVGPGAIVDTPSDVKLLAQPYDESVRETPDLVVCRHTLEHIPSVSDFVNMVAASLRPRTPTVYFEVPDTLRILREGAFWDLYYEHCSYFTAPTLSALFAASGFDVLDTRLGFDDQYVLLEARVMPSGESNPEPRWPTGHAAEVLDATRRFAATVCALRDEWSDRLAEWRKRGASIAVWGASSKAVAFLSTTGAADMVDVVVDINPRKHGRYLPSSAIAVVGPEDLASVQPDVVIVMNPVYLEEIQTTLRERGLNPEVVAA